MYLWFKSERCIIGILECLVDKRCLEAFVFSGMTIVGESDGRRDRKTLLRRNALREKLFFSIFNLNEEGTICEEIFSLSRNEGNMLGRENHEYGSEWYVTNKKNKGVERVFLLGASFLFSKQEFDKIPLWCFYTERRLSCTQTP